MLNSQRPAFSRKEIERFKIRLVKIFCDGNIRKDQAAEISISSICDYLRENKEDKLCQVASYLYALCLVYNRKVTTLSDDVFNDCIKVKAAASGVDVQILPSILPEAALDAALNASLKQLGVQDLPLCFYMKPLDREPIIPVKISEQKQPSGTEFAKITDDGFGLLPGEQPDPALAPFEISPPQEFEVTLL